MTNMIFSRRVDSRQVDELLVVDVLDTLDSLDTLDLVDESGMRTIGRGKTSTYREVI